MSAADELMDYLPLLSDEHAGYINSLKGAFDDNYKKGHYQFAFFAFHLLYMSSFYVSAWQIRVNRPQAFCESVAPDLVRFERKERKKRIEEHRERPLVLSLVSESRSFEVLGLIGCDDRFIKGCKDIVEVRNNVAHASGNFEFKEREKTDGQLERMLDQIKIIQTHMKDDLHGCLKKFLTEYHQDYQDLKDSLIEDELLGRNYFSREDMRSCAGFDIEGLRSNDHFEEIEALFNAFKRYCEEEAGIDLQSP